jgi:Flp pilus assembly protein TadB
MNDAVPILAILIPIIAIVGGLALALNARSGFLKHQAKRMELEHQERMLAIEKGLPLPQIPSPPIHSRQRNPYLWGFILLAVGTALVIGGIMDNERNLSEEMAVMFVGVAILLANWLFTRDRKRKEKQAEDMSSQTSL